MQSSILSKYDHFNSAKNFQAEKLSSPYFKKSQQSPILKYQKEKLNDLVRIILLITT